ncbi:MAG: oligoendopeptidase F [Lachnospiraceae bacterium]
MGEFKKVPVRSEVDPKDTWATEDLYATDAAWEEDFKVMMEYGPKIAAFKGRLKESGETLYQYLVFKQEAMERIMRLANYAMRKSDQDTKNALYQGMVARFMSVMVDVEAEASFETPELIALAEETLSQFYLDKPELCDYKRLIDEQRRRKDHILSEAEEKLLAAAGEMAGAPSTLFSYFGNADLTFESVKDAQGREREVTHGSFIPLMESEDRSLRKAALESVYHTYEGFKNTAAGFLSAQVKQLQFFAKARHYNSTLEAALDATNVPTAVYHNLIKAVHENMDTMYKYVALRKKLLGVEELHFYDLYTSLVPSANVEIPFEEAKKTVLDAVKPLGKEYGEVLAQGFENRWIDVYENVGKRSGAYSAGAKVHPYVLLNYSGTLDSEFTLAHEMGHAMHSYLSNKNQPIYSDYEIFVAEIASTCNESLLMQHLLKNTTDKMQRAYLINHFLEQFKGTVFRQTMFAEFEMNINRMSEEGKSLTADALCEEYSKLQRLYFGKDIVIDHEIEYEWARIPHFFYNFYVFQYATGFSSAIALSQKILKEGEPAVKKYLEFLSGGCSQDPINLLKGAGVDMTSAQPINDALKLFGDLVDELDELLK